MLDLCSSFRTANAVDVSRYIGFHFALIYVGLAQPTPCHYYRPRHWLFQPFDLLHYSLGSVVGSCWRVPTDTPEAGAKGAGAYFACGVVLVNKSCKIDSTLAVVTYSRRIKTCSVGSRGTVLEMAGCQPFVGYFCRAQRHCRGNVTWQLEALSPTPRENTSSYN